MPCLVVANENHATSRLAVAAFIARLQIGERIMLEAIAVILLVLWGLGLVTSFTMSGFIHVLLVLAIIVVLIRVIRGNPVID
jgi:hypothetical protein